MFESMNFTYDGISSEDFGVVMVNSGSGLFKEPFLANRTIIEKSTANRDVPIFTGVGEKPLSFPLTIFIEEWEKRDNLRAIARWLNQKEYKPFWFESNPDRVMDVLIEGTPQLVHNGIKEGYITLNVRCKTHYYKSQPKIYERTINGTYTDWINNDGDETIAPYIEIKKIGNGGTVQIQTSVEGRQVNNLIIKDMLDGEIAYINCVDEQIRSSYADTERYLFDLFNDDYLRFEIGNIYDAESSTEIVFKGNFSIKMAYEVIYRA